MIQQLIEGFNPVRFVVGVIIIALMYAVIESNKPRRP